MSFIKEFKEFATRGNVVDLAVGIIIGGAFGKIVSSLVADIIMPPIGLIIGGIKFTDLKIGLKDDVTLNIGNFIQTTFDFIIVAGAIFFIIKLMNSLKRKKIKDEAVSPSTPSVEVQLLTEIRDLLKKQP
ncbi:large-conductance mechanosensitive channel protein MscL [Desulfosporosinus nitroreducens]|uniref:Large-conductance mechanosensitive channel n=1 Tax=Desulfosporosinus nitroreducens TaxID=2018668 RepID=A0ABT8QZ05_9FIRM|nr:large-conductance mechanosensitive channel protein MscL [Desulfosporosinus nitroreducens]MCO1604252.1 large-conductance mechanosensitive channel protein MscL [Desulfosporosinus nitroreducens]MDO0825779.1 large-conductance mechanosensitive channel protein MscL [Desulfosporosinus nitroreducens]